jgi:hypothetical protein
MRSSSLDLILTPASVLIFEAANSRAFASTFCEDAFSTAVLKLLSSLTAGCSFVFSVCCFLESVAFFFGQLELGSHLQRCYCHYHHLQPHTLLLIVLLEMLMASD